METKKYLDEAGLRILWGKIKSGQAKLAGDIATLEAALRGEINGVAGNLNNYVLTSAKGAANGVASLDNTGKVPAAQLPGYVDDVIEGALVDGKFIPSDAGTLEEKNEDGSLVPKPGKIYLDITNNKTYRWSGTQYTVIGGDLALGETSSTAFPGDRGKAIEDDYVSKFNENQSVGLKQLEFRGSKGNVTKDAMVTFDFDKERLMLEVYNQYWDESEYYELMTNSDSVALTEDEINAACV